MADSAVKAKLKAFWAKQWAWAKQNWSGLAVGAALATIFWHVV